MPLWTMNDDFNESVLRLRNGEVRELPIDSPFNELDPNGEILRQFSLSDLNRATQDLQFQYNFPLCRHVSINTRKELVICTNPAGQYTQHEGHGRCARHEMTLIKPRSPYVSKLVGYTDIQELFESFSNREKKLNDLTEEINIARTMLGMQLKRLEKGKSGQNDDAFRNILAALESVRRLGETMAKIGLAESNGVTYKAIEAFLWQITEILNQEIADPDQRIRILDRVATECVFVEN